MDDRTDADDVDSARTGDTSDSANASGETSESAAALSGSSEIGTDSLETGESSDPGTSDPALAGADDPLVVGALATFHTAVLVAALVAGLYLAGPLGELLGGLQTALGLGFYLALWATTWWTNRRWLGVAADPETDARAAAIVGLGGRWGSLNGVCFFWVLFVVAVVQIGELELGAIAFFLVAWAIGSVLALGIGGIVGALFAALDVALFRAADRLVQDAGADRERPDETP